MPEKTYEDAEKWMKESKSKLDSFIQHSSNHNYIAFDMLENKNAKNGPTFTKNCDIINYGEKILLQLDGQQDITLGKIEHQLG